ncbi:MAG: tRNA (adenosine(37)-N6)-threonylcarbamoyltransferase complex ATPase subunit type 1 TsaE [Caldiserica bacterium]|nr:tRNA (adenosine(37)-N6)-threonylcarbamoyltransferase complex ATPase subunit type 1 TsaE [Caldisericota bacterium]
MTYETCIEVPFLSRCHQSTEGIGILLGSCLLETLAQGSRESLVIGLIGPLGAGKTVLTGALSAALGVDRASVASPTFVLERNYTGKEPVRHFDLYRIEDARQLVEMGFEEELDKRGVTVIEWAERSGRLLAMYERIEVHFEILSEEVRRIVLRDFYRPSIIARCFGVDSTVPPH